MISETTLFLENRFDVIIKYMYAKSCEINTESTWFKELYIEHIRVFNGFIEENNTKKLGKDDFIKAYEIILNSINDKGFDPSFGSIPLGIDNTPLNGAHRLAACLFYGKNPLFKKEKISSPVYDYKYFKNRGIQEKYLDSVAIEYCKLNKNSFLVFIFPSINELTNEAKSIIKNAGKVFYKKDISLTKTGQIILMRQLYKNEKWLGNDKDDYAGAKRKAKWCFQGKEKLQVFVIRSHLESLTKAKLDIRKLYGMGNHTIHTTDTHEESIRLAQQVFNLNSIHFMNNAKIKNFPKYSELLTHYKVWLKSLAINEEFLCIDGSSVIAAYGIRDSRDLDYINFGDYEIDCTNHEIDNHNSELHFHPTSKDEIIFNPENHFYYDGLKYASLNIIKKMKKNRNETKDRYDIQLINSLLEGKKEPLLLLIKIKARKVFTKTYILSKLRDFKLFVKMIYLIVSHRIIKLTKIVYRNEK